MEMVFIGIGITISFISLFFVFFSKNKRETSYKQKKYYNDDYNESELEFRDLRNDIRELMKEFNRSATFNTNLLDEKIAYIKEIRDDIEAKELKLNKLMTDAEIMHNRLRKTCEEIDETYIKHREYKYEDEKKYKNTRSLDNHKYSRYDNKENSDTKTINYYETDNINKTNLNMDKNPNNGENDEKIIKMIPKPNQVNKINIDLEDEILNYYRQGLTIKEISEKTNKSLSEIEFIMGLRRMN
ncbi:MAG: hypothetical protein GX287_06690 [Fusobacteria bacterium]|nr:hypothetical protein [Fusobacteriota bacterium]